MTLYHNSYQISLCFLLNTILNNYYACFLKHNSERLIYIYIYIYIYVSLIIIQKIWHSVILLEQSSLTSRVILSNGLEYRACIEIVSSFVFNYFSLVIKKNLNG